MTVARVTRLSVEVLHDTSSNVARTTRLSTEVLHDTSSNVARTTRLSTEILYTFGPPLPVPSPDPQPCDKTYGSFEYGVGVEYGGANCDPSTVFDEVSTPARDLILIKFVESFVVNTAYLTTSNWVVTDVVSGEVHKVIKVLEPMDGSKVTSQALLVVEKHVAGTEYTLGVQNLTTSGGILLALTTLKFIAGDAKANSMMAVTPRHFNLDPKVSTFRHVMQAIAAADDLIGSK